MERPSQLPPAAAELDRILSRKPRQLQNHNYLGLQRYEMPQQDKQNGFQAQQYPKISREASSGVYNRGTTPRDHKWAKFYPDPGMTFAFVASVDLWCDYMIGRGAAKYQAGNPFAELDGDDGSPKPSPPPRVSSASIVTWLDSISFDHDTIYNDWLTSQPIRTASTALIGLGIDLNPGGLLRGVYTVAGSREEQWHIRIQITVNYQFARPDLLEEALESPGSGVTHVGIGLRRRNIGDGGNKKLADIGENAIGLLLAKQIYAKRTEKDSDSDDVIKTILHEDNLDFIGRQTAIESFIRKSNPKIKAPEDRVITVARGMRGIFGAVYIDGGFPGLNKVMSALRIGQPDGEELGHV